MTDQTPDQYPELILEDMREAVQEVLGTAVSRNDPNYEMAHMLCALGKSLDHRFNRVEKGIRDLWNKIGEAQTEISSVQSELEDVQSELSNVQIEVSNLS